mgnify:CR=1 FL=1
MMFMFLGELVSEFTAAVKLSGPLSSKLTFSWTLQVNRSVFMTKCEVPYLGTVVGTSSNAA